MTTLKDLFDIFYQEFLALYEDEELALLATAAVVGDLVADDPGLPPATASA